ncbi:PDDEXK nuclease domain-containing protein [Legionella quinlivanii]|uniref:PDDEXK nuclease domain-containing protein n=1 Tax=Legionella quinlivanii TaxID=45073 RepID=UPI002243A7CD|nr:PDDEXK nuclease domain-containing protein [Legionella quinlivanii]MCW8450619.1 PDDEXK nuclease domain-containing protein [Legionella quinlivanii]
MNEQKNIAHNVEYKKWITDLKSKLKQAQLKAAVTVNQQLLMFYWELGTDILEKQKITAWGEGLLKQLSQDLMSEFPDMKGFSERNLRLIRQWVQFWLENSANWQQAVAELTQIPWGHNQVIINKCKSADEGLYYIRNTIEYGWSRSVLTHQIESNLWQREGKALSNFTKALPSPQSDLAHQTLKDPYVFDFLRLTKGYDERDLEQGLIEHITQFLLELGAGFAYIGRQVPLQVGEREFFIDLLFYHTRLHCYLVVELKNVDFEPEHVGKLNFYIKAVDAQLRRQGDEPTIGLLLCKSHDKLVVEYALSDVNKPIGVSEYQITQSLPEELKSSLPTVEEIEAELGGDVTDE